MRTSRYIVTGRLEVVPRSRRFQKWRSNRSSKVETSFTSQNDIAECPWWSSSLSLDITLHFWIASPWLHLNLPLNRLWTCEVLHLLWYLCRHCLLLRAGLRFVVGRGLEMEVESWNRITMTCQVASVGDKKAPPRQQHPAIKDWKKWRFENSAHCEKWNWIWVYPSCYVLAVFWLSLQTMMSWFQRHFTQKGPLLSEWHLIVLPNEVPWELDYLCIGVQVTCM